jgi:uncharacterized protein with PQ loop repeat
MATDLIGWAATGILFLTIAWQVYTQWRERSTQGVSGLLFVGQLAASVGFVIYSALLSNWVFVVANGMLIVTAAIGQLIYRRNRRLEKRGEATHDAHGRPAHG